MSPDSDINRNTDVDAAETPIGARARDRHHFPLGRARMRVRTCLQSLMASALLIAALISVNPLPVFSQAVELVVVDVRAVAKGYRTSKLIGSSVVNDQNERIGTIDDIIIGQDRVLFAVLQVGGFLGLGGHLVAVPYQSLVLDESGSKITLPGATRDQLKKLPEFDYS